MGLALLMALWGVVLFDPHWLLASYGVRILLRVPTLLFVALLALLLLGVPTTPRWQQRWTWYPPLLLALVAGAISVPFAINQGFAREALQVILLEWSLIVGTVAFIGTARRAEHLLLMFCLSFVWWGLWGARRGLIPWHPLLANYDGYGAYMVIGIGLCSFVMTATKGKAVRYLMIAAVGLGIVGVVASFARGAFLAALAVFITVWARSPKKGKTLGAGLLAGAAILVAAALIHPGQFWAEIQSAFTEGTTEGTGEDRWVLWTAAWKVFLEHPVLGVGHRNVGVFGAQFFEVGDLGGLYEFNPGRLYGRSLHSLYFTMLSEQGLVGCVLFVWLLVDFWKRNRAMQSEAAGHRWASLGGRLELSAVARGLEVAMVGFLAVAAVYSVAGFQCYYTILGVNLLLHRLAFTSAGPGRYYPKRRPRYA